MFTLWTSKSKRLLMHNPKAAYRNHVFNVTDVNFSCTLKWAIFIENNIPCLEYHFKAGFKHRSVFRGELLMQNHHTVPNIERNHFSLSWLYVSDRIEMQSQQEYCIYKQTSFFLAHRVSLKSHEKWRWNHQNWISYILSDGSPLR